ncbi:hypothetical protein, conserved [Leishmania tarentolae]|uniref:REH2 DRSM domain-containing protein n=1 Tax=Leishmania tarentolae TaxID=5689 RepID=A0A640KLT7_LEITA|nr:hypothetical protein, conserved [Leishmania tarentolae]
MPPRLCALGRGKQAHGISLCATPCGSSGLPPPEDRTPPPRNRSIMEYRFVASSSQLCVLMRHATALHLPRLLAMAHTAMRAQCRFPSSSSSQHHSHTDSAAAVRIEDNTDDWSSIEVEVLMPAPDAAPHGSISTSSTADDAATSGRFSAASPTDSRNAFTSVVTIDAIDSYAKAKVSNFVRRWLKPSASGASDAASSSSAVGLEVRQVQGGGKVTQYHARWRLPLPVEFGERYGEGFAPTPKEAEAVAAMHAERVIDALGFQLFQLSSKQRKHAEAVRAAGRWAPMPAITTTTTATSSSGASLPTAEVVPPPDTPSPPPLQLLGLSAQQRQEKELRIDHLQFAPVHRGGFAPLSFTLASPHYFDSSSHGRIERFFRVHRTSFKANLRLILLKSGGPDTTNDDGVGEGVEVSQHVSKPGSLFLAQLILPLPPRFGRRVAMGKAPTRKEAVLLACMHAELIIDAVGFALYPESREKQAAHAVECAKMHRWCTQPGDCVYRYTAASPPPMELVDELHRSTVAAATMTTSSFGSSVAEAPLHRGAESQADHAREGARGSGTSSSPILLGDAQVGSAPSSGESMLLQHQQAVLGVRYFIDAPSLQDFEPARLLLERYVSQFVSRCTAHADATICTAAASATGSSLTELMLVDELGQRDRRVFRATITVPLVNSKSEQAAATAEAEDVYSSSLLPYMQSFVAIGVSYTRELAELAAALHALRTLGALNRLCLVRTNASVAQAMESFAMRAQIPLHDSAQPTLDPSQLPPESLPAPVRAMEGFVGRIATSGLNLRDGRPLPKGIGSEKVRKCFGTHIPLLSEEVGTAVNTLNREDDLLRELRARQERLPRMHWDTSPDADDRIIVSPDQDAKMSRMYNHTLSSVRQPDVRATTRLKDYLERHGKSPEMALSVVRVYDKQQRSEECGLYVAKVVLPVTLRHQPKRRRCPPSADESQMSARSSSDSSSTRLQQPGPSQMPEYVAQGEGPTRDDAILLCAAHAEALLDAAGQPFYDHPLLQRKHADTARALGRWAPLVRGAALPPESLRRKPPPLRKVTQESAVWARVQEQQRRASVCEDRMSEPGGHAADALSPTSSTSSRHARATTSVNAAVVDDEALCDIAGLQFVYHTDISQNALRLVAEYFSKNGSDIYRVVRQYTVIHSELGVIHRAIVEMPLPASYGKRYAVGCASTKRHALFLCCSHVLLILDALRIPVFSEYGRQRMYARAAAVRGRDVPLCGKPYGKSDTPSPPGLYYLTTCTAAREKPPDIPKLPSLRDCKSLSLWGTFVSRCAAHVTRRRETHVTEAVTSAGGSRVPRSNVVAEDATSDIADSMPCDKFARRQLLDLCFLAGLPGPTDDTPSKSVALSPNERRFFTSKELAGTPYTMRGVSDASPAESRHRAFGHGIQLLLLVVRPNSVSTPTPRRSWWDGQQRTLCIHDHVRNEVTPYGCLWVLRIWAAIHYPPRYVRIMLRKVELRTEERGKVVACVRDSDAGGNPQLTPSRLAPSTVCPPTHSQGVASIVESRDGAEKVLYHAVCETASPGATTSSDSVHRALRQLLSDVQRLPTMQTLTRFLCEQPQLHIPSARVLVDPDNVVHRLHALVCDSHSSEHIVPSAEPRQAGHLAVLLALLKHDHRSTSSFYTTWPVELLLKWTGAPSSVQGWAASKDGDADCGQTQSGWLPSTLESTFVRYGLARAAPSATTELRKRAPSMHRSSPTVPTPLAGALALLCRCLPPLPDALMGGKDGMNTVAGQAAAGRTRLTERDRELPLQLAHLILMGLLLGCTPWAVRAAAIVACAEHTLEWYDQQQRLSAVAGSRNAPEDTPPLSAVHFTPYVSVDVTEAVLASLDATALPLPETVLHYASEVERRLEALWMEASATAAAGKAPSLPWLLPPEAWGTCLGKADASKSFPSPQASILTLAERRILRPLLQCAIAASAAPHAVWVRATGMEKRGGADEIFGEGANWSLGGIDMEEQRLVFQHRHAAHYAAVRMSKRDLNLVETLESANDISTMATCFAVFGCAVYPTESVVALPLEQERDSAWFCASRAEDEAQTSNGVTHDAADAGNADEGGEEEDEKLEDLGDEDVDVGQFARVFGTCISPLAAALVAAAPTRSASLQPHCSIYTAPDNVVAGGALRAVGENLPMLMTAFQETVPLLVHRHSSVPLLSSLSAHLRSRVETTTPFLPEERRAISQLFTMTLHRAGDEAA